MVKAVKLAHYQEIIEHMLANNPGVDKYFSYIVIKAVFVKNAVPLSAILPRGTEG
jgi:hypothetical protein